MKARKLLKSTVLLFALILGPQPALASTSPPSLAVIVEVLSTGLVSRIVSPSDLPSGSCHLEGDVYYTPDAYRYRRELERQRPPEVVSLFSEAEAKSIFKLLAKDKSIPFGYTPDGCYARAQAMADRLFKMGRSSEKVWALGGALSPNPAVNWRYHVAVAINVRLRNGKFTKWVIDPSLANQPLTADQWLSKFYDSRVAGAPLHTGWPRPLGDPQGKPMLYFSPSTVYYPDSQYEPDYSTFKRDLDEAQKTNSDFRAKLKEIKPRGRFL